MRFDYSKLRGRAAECGMTQKELACAAGITKGTYSQKMNNNSEFSPSEIVSICGVLGIPHDQIHTYFFTPEVQKN